MARIRTIKPEFWQDEKLAPCDPITRLVFLGLLSMADDAGRLLDNVKVIDAFIFPDTSTTCRGSVDELSAIGRIQRGETASGQRIIQITNWDRHQKIEKPNLRGALPVIDLQRTSLQQVTEIPRRVGETSGKDRGNVGEESGRSRRTIPTTNDLRPTISTSTNDLFSGVADAPPGPQVVRAPRPRTSPQFPHFSRDRCDAMHATWVSTRGAVEYGRFRKTIGPLFTIAEADRPPEAPTDAELADALRSFAEMAGIGAESRFATIDRAAQCLAEIARTRRRFATDPIARSDAVMRIIHGKAAA